MSQAAEYWFVKFDGNQLGPHSRSEVIEMLKSGQIDATCEVRETALSGEWHILGDLQEIFGPYLPSHENLKSKGSPKPIPVSASALKWPRFWLLRVLMQIARCLGFVCLLVAILIFVVSLFAEIFPFGFTSFGFLYWSFFLLLLAELIRLALRIEENTAVSNKLLRKQVRLTQLMCDRLMQEAK